MFSKIKKIIKTRTLIDSSISLIGNLLGAIISLAVLAVLTRSLTTQEFGVFTAFRNFFILIGGLINFGLSQWLLAHFKRSSQPQDQSKTYSKILSLILIVSLFFVLALFGLFSQREKFLATSSLAIFILSLIGSVGNAVYTLNLTVLQAQLKFLSKSAVDIVWNLARLFPIIILAYLHRLNDFSAILSSLLGFLLGLAISFYAIKVKIKLHLPSLKEIKSIFKFSSWIGLNQITITLYGRVSVLLLTMFYSAELVGIYGAADQLTNFFPVIISSVASVVSARFANFQSSIAAKVYFKKSFLLSLGLAASFILVNQVAKPVISLVLSQKYLHSIPVFKALVLANIPLALSIAPVSRIIYFHKQSRIVFIASLVQLVTLITLNLIWLPQRSILAPANSLLVANSLGLLIYTYYLWIKS